MDSDEEVDYMSDDFLKSICGTQDIRPGLIKCHAQQYDHKRAVKNLENNTKNRLVNPSLKEREEASRESGLNKPIDDENVGFKMLKKLGFTPGSGLGKAGKGRVEPVSVEVKKDRQGLGRKSSLEEIARMRAKYRNEAKERLLNIGDYRTRKAEEAAERSRLLDLRKSQRVCWELDSKECIEEPAESWFWPENKIPLLNEEKEETNEEGTGLTAVCAVNDEGKEEEETGDDIENDEHFEDIEFSVHEKLEMLTLYLRNTYLYCVWCGHSFEDDKDLQKDCPGPTREDH